MNRPESTHGSQAYEPRHPTQSAVGFLVLWIAILVVPMVGGKLLAGPWSDMYATGFAWRVWIPEQWKATGQMPLWNPLTFGGMPLVASMHGDLFYPTAWLRLALPAVTAVNLGFVLHYLAAGLFLYWLLRDLEVTWTGSLVGAFSYQLSGVVISLASPGHDGKLFVTALFPLALLALLRAFRSGRLEYFALFALTVGLATLSPHFQMLYYMLVAAGVFALYLAFGERDRPPMGRAALLLGLSLLGVGLGLGIAAIQLMPFFEYIPFSPRAESYYGYEGAITWAIPWAHVPEFFLADFVGSHGDYWGTNAAKLHSEYLGAPVVALAVLGAADPKHRRLALWLGGIGLLFLLVSLGGSTPFYRVWWGVMPFMKKVRAAGMAFYLVAFVVAVFAAFGAQRLERREAPRWGVVTLVLGATVALLAILGVFGAIAESIAQGIEMEQGRAVAGVARAASGRIAMGAALSGLALALVGLVVVLYRRGVMSATALALALPLLVSADLWRNGREFWIYSDAPRQLYAPDPIVERVTSTPPPYRLLNFPGEVFPGADVYPGSSLMKFGVPQLLGYHGNELSYFDELTGGKNVWRYVPLSPRLWDLFAVKFVVLPSGSGIAEQLPGFTEAYEAVLTDVRTSSRRTADLYARREPIRYARLVPAAIEVEQERAILTIVDPRTGFDPDRIVLLDPEADLDVPGVERLPEPLGVAATVEHWQPGHMSVRLDNPAPQDAYLVVSENWYPDWRATVDGNPVETVRGNVSLITVPVARGSRAVELAFVSGAYDTGKLITWLSLVVTLIALGVPPAMRRRRG